METLDGFAQMFFSNEIFFIFLAVSFIVLLIVLVYLLKLQSKARRQVKESLKKEEEYNKIEEGEFEEDPLGIFASVMPENDEEAAIISTEELAKASEKLSNTLEMNTSEIIEMYEEEQEKKAIISYEELLKNASSLNVKYEKPERKELDEPIVQEIKVTEERPNVKESTSIEKEEASEIINIKEPTNKNESVIETKVPKSEEEVSTQPKIEAPPQMKEEVLASKITVESTGKIMDYVEEEEFLKLLKEFRMDLET